MRYQALSIWPWQQPDNKLLARLRHDGFLRHHTSIIPLAKNSVDARKHARAQLQAAVVNASPHTNRTTIRVNQRINGLQDSSELTTRQGIQLRRSQLPATNFGLKALGQAVVHKNSFNVFNIDNVSAVLQVVANVDHADTRQAVKRCQDLQTRSGCVGQRQLGLGHLQSSSAFVYATAADEILLCQFLIALVVSHRDAELSLRLLHLRLRQTVIQLHQQLTDFDTVAVAKVELRDASTDLRPEHHALTRTQRANSLCVIHQLHDFNLGDFNGRLASAALGDGRRGCYPRRFSQ